MSSARGRGRRGHACGPERTTRAPRRAIGRCRPGSHTSGVHLATVDDTWCSLLQLERTEPSTSVPDTPKRPEAHESAVWSPPPAGDLSWAGTRGRRKWACSPRQQPMACCGVVSASSAADAAEDEKRYSDDDQDDENGPQHGRLRSLLVSSEGIRGPGVASHPTPSRARRGSAPSISPATKSSAPLRVASRRSRGRVSPWDWVRATPGRVCGAGPTAALIPIRRCEVRRSYCSSARRARPCDLASWPVFLAHSETSAWRRLASWWGSRARS